MDYTYHSHEPLIVARQPVYIRSIVEHGQIPQNRDHRGKVEQPCEGDQSVE